jgi:hypothetical protein
MPEKWLESGIAVKSKMHPLVDVTKAVKEAKRRAQEMPLSLIRLE